ncbi:MAG: SpoIIE family protein phosphatase, partial [Bacteroidota bacterium]
SMTDLGRISGLLGDYEQAEQYLFLARQKAIKLDAKSKLVDIYFEQAQLYKRANEPALALKHYEEHMAQKNLVEGEQSVLRLKNLQAVFEIEKSQREAEIERLRNVELRTLVGQIEKQQEDMLASIRYARGIQDALLPPIHSIESKLPRGFVFYYPKDIVSGDFYWYAEVGNLELLAAVDCTGHGVPGAFMVVLSNTLLNEIVHRDQIIEPTRILEELDARLTHILQQRDAEHFSYDGLDIALVQRDPGAGRVKFAGAKRPLICLRKGEVYRIKGSRSSIGGWVGEEHLAKEFEQVEWILQPEDRFFLFSDGFADQFGGPHGKKYGVKRFRELLRQLPHEPRRAKEGLREVHLQWRGTEPQTDDLVVMGWQEPYD